MLKILIVCKEIEIAKDYVNSITSRISDLRLIGIANTLIEAEGIMIKDKPDLILTNIPTILSFVKETFILHLPKIILISEKNIKKDVTENVILVKGNMRLPIIKSYLEHLIKENTMLSIKEQVIQLLLDLGFDFRNAGTNYLVDAILYTHSYEGSHYFEKLNRDVYSYIAKVNETTVKRVGWAINRSVSYMYEKHTKRTYANVEKYFKIKYPEKPTPKLIINLIANNLDS